MTHRHEIGEVVSEFFVAQYNKDQTEGRGPMIDAGVFLNHEDAYKRIKGEAVMGQGDGDVVKRTYYRCGTCPEIVKVDERIYHGDNYFKKNMAGQGTYANFLPDGWRRDYSKMESDPEFAEFLRLKKKFGQ